MSRFLVRGGSKLRKKMLQFRRAANKKYRCTNRECSRLTLKRTISGIFKCRICQTVVAGKCYSL